MEEKTDYSDIIDHPHFVSRQFPRMSMEKRAAQFSPFKALTGFEEAVDEVVRFSETQEEIAGCKIDKKCYDKKAN